MTNISIATFAFPENMLVLFPFGSYLLLFDDDEEDGNLPQRAVPFYRVVPLPEGHRQ